MNYIKIKKTNKKIIKLASKIKSSELKWAWIKFIYARKNKNSISLNSTLKSSLFEILSIKNFKILNFYRFFQKKQKKNKTLVYCNAKHYKNIFVKFFKKINQNPNDFLFYSPFSIDWIRFGLNINKFYISEYNWNGYERELSSLEFVKLVDSIILNDLKKIQPDRIFLIEGDSYIHNLINKNAKLLNIKTITIQNGYNIFIEPVLSWKNINSKIYISRGYMNTKYLKKYSTSKFVTTGLLNYNENKSKKNKIYEVCFILQRDKNNKFLNYILNFAKKFYQKKILIKLHPSSKFSISREISNLDNVYILKKRNDLSFLNNVNFVVSEFSSVLLESLLYKCRPIAVYKYYKKTILKFLPKHNLGYCFEDFDILKKNEKKIFYKTMEKIKNKKTTSSKHFFDSFKKQEGEKIKRLCK